MELNLSCPHGMGERGMGLACGQVRAHPPQKKQTKKKNTPKYTREEMDVRTIKCKGVTIYSFVVSSGPSAGKEHLSLGA